MRLKNNVKHIIEGKHTTNIVGWLLALLGSAVYLLTMEPTVSFWDCGEFIAVSAGLQVGHPPGAPFYQLLAHIFTLFAAQATSVAAWCNALSALAGGFTVMFVYWSVLMLLGGRDRHTWTHHVGAVVGALCYMFCDTAWFSAVESEVYSLAMLIASIAVWAMLRWYYCHDRRWSARWLMLVALLLGLGYCTHQLTLLTTPALLLLFIFKIVEQKKSGQPLPVVPFLSRVLPLLVLFFAIGLSPYLIIPIRAAADTPINQCHSGEWADVKAYLNRDQYEKAPVYPRMWRHHKNDALYAQSWNGGDTNVVGNLSYFASYQLTYMYFRYLMWNFAGRYNDRQGYGSPQNGQFITGWPFVDRSLVGTGKTPPKSLHTRGHNVYYLLPLLLGILGLGYLYRSKKMFWVVLTLFLMGGAILSVYLNHPCYEPRERDYAYVLSFMAFGMMIGAGAARVAEWLVAHAAKLHCGSTVAPLASAVLLMCVPVLMAFQNWDDHDRSHRYIAYDSAKNLLNSCDQVPQGSVLFCYGDNDTFPVWYLQNVENERSDVHVENIGLLGWRNFSSLLEESIAADKPIYFTHYAYDQYRSYFNDLFQLEGFVYRLVDTDGDSVAVEPSLRHIQQMGWHDLEGVYVDEVGCKFLEMYWRDMVLIANNMIDAGRSGDALWVLNKTLKEIPLHHLQDVTLRYKVGETYRKAGDGATAHALMTELDNVLDEQLRYFQTMSVARQKSMPYTLGPRVETKQLLNEYFANEQHSL